MILGVPFWDPFWENPLEGSSHRRLWADIHPSHVVYCHICPNDPKGCKTDVWDPQNSCFSAKTAVLDPFWTILGPPFSPFSPFSHYGTPLGHLPLYSPLILTLLDPFSGVQKGLFWGSKKGSKSLFIWGICCIWYHRTLSGDSPSRTHPLIDT